MTKGKAILILILVTLFLLPFFQTKIFTLIDKLSFKIQPSVKPIPASSSSAVLSTSTGKVKYQQDYTIVLVGDSMTQLLGNSDELRGYLKKYYPQKTFEILNYGFGSTSLLSVPDRLEKTTFFTRDFMPINDIDYNILILESFGHNPLSQYPLEEGLKIQTETLDKIVQTIKTNNPHAKLVFMATIAPNKNRYGEGQVNLEPDQRKKWAEERIAYIKNHIEYAKNHQIPLINVYDKSLDDGGNGKLALISDKDFIHPSPTGVYFISEQIAKFLFEEKIIP